MKNHRKTPKDLKEAPDTLALHSLMYAMSGENPSRAIEDQERRGQQAVRHTDVLPNKISQRDREILTSLGFQIGEVLPHDDLFLEATLPEGWAKRPTDHSMYTDLVDPQGRRRGSIGYKAASYDRWVSFHLCSRYDLQLYHPTGEYEFGKSFYGVVDTAQGGVFVYVPTPEDIERHKPEQRWDGKGDNQACSHWLNQHFPDWKSPAAYWD